MSRNDEGDARHILHDDTARRPGASTVDSGMDDARESRLNTHECSSLRAAIAYAELGLRVLPAHSIGRYRQCTCGDKRCRSKAKHPRTIGGVHDASSDERTVRAWWSTWPDANVAIATGHGLLVVDVDDHYRCGYWSWCRVGPHYYGFPDLPETWAAWTGRGVHVYFAVNQPYRCRANVLAGIDIRGEDGYVLAPPSRHPRGCWYRWAEGRSPWQAPLAPAPPWLLELLAEPAATGPRDYPRCPWDGAIPQSVFQLIRSDPKVAARFHRDATGPRDRSQSGVDASLSCLLALRGVEAVDIEHGLLASHRCAGLPLKREHYYRRTVGTALARVRRDERR